MAILYILLPFVALFAGHAAFRRIADPARRIRIGYRVAGAHTLLYWIWESQAGGNIRVDLAILYPYLALMYALFLWPRLRWWSLAAAAALMALNWAFFVASYMIFDKPLG